MKTLCKQLALTAALALVLAAGGAHAQHLNIEGGATMKLQPGASVIIPGNFRCDGAFNADAASYTVFSGTGNQTVLGRVVFGRLVRRDGGLLTLLTDINVADSLLLEHGHIALGSRNLLLLPTARVGGPPSVSSFVVTDGSGTVRRVQPGTGSYLFPVGSIYQTAHSRYTPATLQFTAGSSSMGSSVGVRTVDSKHPDNNATTNYLDRYWIVDQSNTWPFTCNTSFVYDNDDLVGAASSMWLAQWNGTYWDLHQPALGMSRTLTGTVSVFGDFTGTPAPVIDVPAAAAFGKVELGSWLEQSLVVENTGGIDLTVTSSTITGANAAECSIVSGGAPFQLAPGMQRTVVVRFTPATATTIMKTASLTFDSNDPTGTAVVQLSGFGIPALEHPCTLLAGSEIDVDAQILSDGPLHANGSIAFARGNPSTHSGDLTAVTRIRIMIDNTIDGDAQAGQVNLIGNATVTGTVSSTSASPVGIPGCTVVPGSTNYTVAQNGSGSIAPGNWGDVTVEKNGTLTVSTGSYNLKKLSLKKGTVLYVNMTHGPVVMNMSTNLSFGVESEVQFSAWGDEASRWLTLNTAQATDVVVGDDARTLGSIHAPYADVSLGAGVSFKGSVRADNIETDAGVAFIHHTSTATLPKQETPGGPSATEYVLEQNYPNPFNPLTTIRYVVPTPGVVVLRVFDAFGREVRTLVYREHPSGAFLVDFDAEDLPSGAYLYSLEAEGVVLTKRMILLR